MKKLVLWQVSWQDLDCLPEEVCGPEMVATPETGLWERATAFLRGCSAGPQAQSSYWQSSASPTELTMTKRKKFKAQPVQGEIQQSQGLVSLYFAPLTAVAWDPLEL